jgi:hypothetical protein
LTREQSWTKRKTKGDVYSKQSGLPIQDWQVGVIEQIQNQCKTTEDMQTAFLFSGL